MLFSILAASPLAHKVTLDAEVVVWAILDILTQGAVGYWLLIRHYRQEETYETSNSFFSYHYLSIYLMSFRRKEIIKYILPY